MNGMRKRTWIELIVWTLILFLVVCSLNSCQPKVDPVEVDYITVKVYWVSYCPYCLEELLVLDQIAHEMVGHPYLEGKVRIIAANIDLTAEELQAILTLDPPYTVTAGEDLPRWSNGFPTTVVKDTFGKPIFMQVGFLSKAQLYEMILEALGFTERI